MSETTIANMPAAVWLVEADRIVFANRAAETLFGGGQPLAGKALPDLLDPASYAAVQARAARALTAAPDTAPLHGRAARADGSWCDVEIELSAWPTPGETTVQMVVRDIGAYRQQINELERSRESLRRLSSTLLEAREDERRRIARELHDGLGQRLMALKIELAGLATSPPAPPSPQRISGMVTILDETIASLRRIAADLRPLMLDDLGLNAAIEWLAAEAARRLDIEVSLHLGESDPPVDDRLATALFRMVQEALNNVACHSRATDVRIALRHDARELRLTIEDNGVGFPAGADQRAGKSGLLGMREQVAMLGGDMEWLNAPDGGARVSIRLPLPAAAGPVAGGSV